jgi:phage host-nuclease inhibitor protein Gam
LVEKLKEDSSKYTVLKEDEKSRVEEVREINSNFNQEFKDLDEGIRKINKEIANIQNFYNAQSEHLIKEVNTLHESNKVLETAQKDIKADQENVKFQFEYEIVKINHDLKSSDEKM